MKGRSDATLELDTGRSEGPDDIARVVKKLAILANAVISRFPCNEIQKIKSAAAMLRLAELNIP